MGSNETVIQRSPAATGGARQDPLWCWTGAAAEPNCGYTRRGDRFGSGLISMIEVELQQGREAYHRRAWTDAHAILSRIDQETPARRRRPRAPGDVGYLTNRDDDCLAALERCHHAYRRSGGARAAPSARRSGSASASPARARSGPRPAGSPAASGSWRARPTASNAATCCCRRSSNSSPRATGTTPSTTATAAAAIGERFQDADLVACALHLQGRALIRKGEVEAGLTLLDEAMVAVVADELSPLMTGLIYCSVILACQEVYRPRPRTAVDLRARPVVRCAAADRRLHRLLPGAPRRDPAARRRLAGCDRGGRPGLRALSEGIDPQPPAAAFYQRAEMHRLRGEFRRRRGGLPARQRLRLRAAAGPRAAAAGARPQGRRGRGDPPGARRDRRSALAARGCCRRRSRSRSPPATSRKRTVPAASSSRSRRASGAACRRRSRRRPAARSCWPKATPRPRWPRCAALSRSGRRSGPPTRPRASGS